MLILKKRKGNTLTLKGEGEITIKDIGKTTVVLGISGNLEVKTKKEVTDDSLCNGTDGRKPDNNTRVTDDNIGNTFS